MPATGASAAAADARSLGWIYAANALSFLGVGVQPPNTSWGTMIAGGFDLLTSAPLLTIIPGTMILLTVLSVNVFGDGLRDALDPKSKLRLEAHTGIAEPEGTAV